MHLHILGICGTFMGGLAKIARERGHVVTGCDAQVYPPMSEQLRELGIALHEGYDAEQLDRYRADLYVVGNAMVRGMPVVEEMLDRGLEYVSGPHWLSEHVLHDKWVIPVAGTHGKSTTASMVAWILADAGLNPGFLIGGIARNFHVSALATDSPFFVIEADEYDTAFFDKRSKFVWYRPRTAILNNLELDHADIFPDLAAIETQFHHLVRIVPANGLLVANGDVAAIDRVLARGCWTSVERFGARGEWSLGPVHDDDSFDVHLSGEMQGTIRWELMGDHNRLNALAALAAARHAGVPVGQGIDALNRFQGVKRRMEVRGTVNGITIYDDFAHHPTAFETTIAGLRRRVRKARIVAVFEPRSNTMKLGTMQNLLAGSLAGADLVYCYAANLGWDPSKALAPLSARAAIYTEIDPMVEALGLVLRPGDHVLVMSNGSFGGVHAKLLARLAKCAVPALRSDAMANYPYRIVNVFTRGGALTGNPLCVFEDGRRLDGAAMQALARQFNLSETTFILPSQSATARVRIFTPAYEMPFAGHPTLGTAHVVRSLQATGDAVKLEMKAGIIPVSAKGDRWTLQANAPRWRAVAETRGEMASMLGLPLSDIADSPLWMNAGKEQLLVPVKSVEAVRRASPRPEAFSRLASEDGQSMAYVFADEGDAAAHVVARFFFPNGAAILEDPATGSACANLGGWFCATRPGTDIRRTVSQGDEVQRPSTLYLDVISGVVFVGGDVIELGRGKRRLLKTLIYLHGFISSPRSKKAVMLGDYLRSQEARIEYLVPELHHRPAQAVSQIQWHCLGKSPGDVTLIGSSLGGFYATAVAEKFGCRAVLLNPAVHPHAHFERFLGPQENLYTHETFELTREHVDELRALDVAATTRPERYWLFVETGDDVLDYREAVAFYRHALHAVIRGGDHTLSSFPEHVPDIVEWALT